MARFREIKSTNPKLSQDQIAKELGCSSSFWRRYRQDINMLSLYKIPAKSNKTKHKISNREHDLERRQMTSNHFKRLQMTSKDDGKTAYKKIKKDLKSGDPNDIHDHGRDLIEQAFSSQ